MINERREILVVDDEFEFRILIQKKLKAAGYQVHLAQSGEDALVALWERPNIGLVLLDIRLPLINGLNVSEIVRKDFPGKKIIVTSVLLKDEQRFLIDNADDYFSKGEDLDVLAGKIGGVLHNKARIVSLRENEKRNSRRIPVNVLASCESVDHSISSSSIHFFSYTRDLSLKGGRFVIAENINLGRYFTAALELPANFLPLLINCEVVWAKDPESSIISKKRDYEVGVRFVKLDLPQDEQKLQDYLNFV